MTTDVALRVAVMDTIIQKFGEVDAERFIYIVKKDNFDYTEWQRDLWKDKTIDEVHKLATEFENNNNNNI